MISEDWTKDWSTLSVERRVLLLLEDRRDGIPSPLKLTMSVIYSAVFSGNGPWSKTQRAGVLRAVNKYAATEPELRSLDRRARGTEPHLIESYDPMAVRAGTAKPPDDPDQRLALRLAAAMWDLGNDEEDEVTGRVLFIGRHMVFATIKRIDGETPFVELDAWDFGHMIACWEQHLRCYLEAEEVDELMKRTSHV